MSAPKSIFHPGPANIQIVDTEGPHLWPLPPAYYGAPVEWAQPFSATPCLAGDPSPAGFIPGPYGVINPNGAFAFKGFASSIYFYLSEILQDFYSLETFNISGTNIWGQPITETIVWNGVAGDVYAVSQYNYATINPIVVPFTGSVTDPLSVPALIVQNGNNFTTLPIIGDLNRSVWGSAYMALVGPNGGNPPYSWDFNLYTTLLPYPCPALTQVDTVRWPDITEVGYASQDSFTFTSGDDRVYSTKELTPYTAAWLDGTNTLSAGELGVDANAFYLNLSIYQQGIT